MADRIVDKSSAKDAGVPPGHARRSGAEAGRKVTNRATRSKTGTKQTIAASKANPTKGTGALPRKTAAARSATPPRPKAPGRAAKVVAAAPSATRRTREQVPGPAWSPSIRAGLVVATLGNKRTAGLLQVSPSQPTRWKQAKEVPGPQAAPLLLDLDHIIARLLLVWDESVIGDWLEGSNAFLDGARPIDVLRTRGSTEVVEAIEAEAAGAYA